MREKNDIFRDKAQRTVAKMTLEQKYRQLMDVAVAVKEHGLEEYNWWNEALHGAAREGRATVFPQAIGLAATFDTGLVERVAECVSDEVRAKNNAYRALGDRGRFKGVNCWSPNINIFRDPRWGRGHETYGEDPYLTSEIGLAFVRGLQGDPNYKFRKTDATLKHFAAHSGPESGRDGFDSKVSKKDFYETYTYAFAKIIRLADPSAVMLAYNAINGVPCICNRRLIGDVLREQFGFAGYTVSDCGGVAQIYTGHKYTDSVISAAAEAVKAGCDLNCGNAYEHLFTAVESGLAEEKDIDEALVRLLTARYRLGMEDRENKYTQIPLSVVECEKHKQLCLEVTRDSIVLLKNDGILPLTGNIRTIAVVGPNAAAEEALLGNYNGIPSKTVSILRGLQESFDGRILYSQGCRYTDEWFEEPINDAVLSAKEADLIILCTGLTPRIEGEDDPVNHIGDKSSLALPEVQYQLFNALKKTGKPIIVINVTGSAVLLNPFDQYSNAVLQCFYPGQDTGTAVADILFGRHNPCGRLPVTFYASDKDLPPFEDYSMRGRTYRYFEGKPLYPFGYGLSYSAFSYQTEVSDDNIVIDVYNNGPYNGAETVLVYTSITAAGAPRKKLVDFDKLYLPVGEEKRISFPIRQEYFSYYNDAGKECFANNADIWVSDAKISVKHSV